MMMPSHNQRSATPIFSGLIVILALAALLRFYLLDGQSFWNDEGNSARIAERSLPLITEGAAGDIHPPLYYYLLHGWRSLFGSSEFALRSLSAVLGVLLVGLTFLIGRRVFGAGVGVLAALLAAINPFQIYYSQEARMYMLLAVIGAAATWLLFRLLMDWHTEEQATGRGRWSSVLLHLSLTLLYAAGLYTHYAFPFIIFTHLVIVAMGARVRRQSIKRLTPWIGVTAAAGVLFIPWLPIAIRQITTWPSTPSSQNMGAMLLDTARLYLLGPTFPSAEAVTALIISGFFLIISLWNPDFDERRADDAQPLPHALRTGAIWLWWLVPVALIFGLGLFKESYLKFLLIGSAAFCVLLARGIGTALGIARGALLMPRALAGQPLAAWSWTLVVAFLCAPIAVPTAQSLHNYYFDPAYARDDYRSIAREIQTRQRPGDAIILNSANQWEVFTYYYPDGPNVYPLPRNRPLDPAAVEAELADLAQKFDRVFVLYWGESEADPDRVIETWLETHTYKAAERWINAIRFVTYAIPAQLSDRPAQPIGARFGAHITLDGYTLPVKQFQPGDILQLDLFWRIDARLDTRYKVFVHVLDANGQIVAQTDREPGGGLNPTTNWEPGASIIDRYGVLLPENAPNGGYTIEIGLYDFDNVRLRIEGDGDALKLGTVEVKSDK